MSKDKTAVMVDKTISDIYAYQIRDAGNKLSGLEIHIDDDLYTNLSSLSDVSAKELNLNYKLDRLGIILNYYADSIDKIYVEFDRADKAISASIDGLKVR